VVSVTPPCLADKLFLSQREREVLRLVARGYSNKMIGRELRISNQTVKNHLWAAFRKLRVEDRTGAVIVAIRCGEIEIPGIERAR
jgi:two-component system response regulator DegU